VATASVRGVRCRKKGEKNKKYLSGHPQSGWALEHFMMRAYMGIANLGALRPVGAPLACAGEVGVVQEPRRGGDEQGLWNHNKKVRKKER
jgi:hypothetical protein